LTVTLGPELVEEVEGYVTWSVWAVPPSVQRYAYGGVPPVGLALKAAITEPSGLFDTAVIEQLLPETGPPPGGYVHGSGPP
jgi:hypothetical protein